MSALTSLLPWVAWYAERTTPPFLCAFVSLGRRWIGGHNNRVRQLDYKAPGPEDQRERLLRWENWLLLISMSLLLIGVAAICICFGALGR